MKKTLYVFGDSYFQVNDQQGWPTQFLELCPKYNMVNVAKGGASLDWIENQIAKHTPQDITDNIGMVVLTHPRRLWITPVHLTPASHGNDTFQLKHITKHHAPDAHAQLEYLKKHNLLDSYQHVYDLLADDEDRWVREIRKTISSIDLMAKYYEKFFVFFAFRDTLKCYRKLHHKKFSNITVVSSFCFDYLFDYNNVEENERYRKLPNHMTDDENYGFAKTLIDALETGVFNCNLLHRYWRKNIYYNENKE